MISAMISSMTAFAAQTLNNDKAKIHIELRSVNHRYLELFFNIPDEFNVTQPELRKRLSASLRRGRIDTRLVVEPHKDIQYHAELNQGLLDALLQQVNVLQEKLPQAEVSLTKLLQWPGVMQFEGNLLAELHDEIVQTLAEAVKKLISVRQTEGARIAEVLQGYLINMREEIDKVEQRMPEVREAQRQRIQQRFAELELQVEQDRIEQELVLLAQRADISEELARLQMHVDEVGSLLNQGGVVGRRLDFLMQELNREANTLASKSADKLVTKSALEMKVLIEQMREQIQNVE